jgi:hypothetical protein
MTRSSIQRIVKGDIIIERVNGKKRMIPVSKVEFNACSTYGVHINRSMCYDFNAVVDLVEGESTLGDMEKEMAGLGDLEEDFDPGVLVSVGSVNPQLKHAHIPNVLNHEEIAELLVKH